MNQPLRILITNSGRKWIGEVGHCVMLYSMLRARGHEVWIGCRRGFALETYAREHGLNFISFNYNSQFQPVQDLKDIGDLRRFLREQGIDILHVHRGKDHNLGMLAAKTAGVPLIRTRHVVTPVKQHIANRIIYGRMTSAIISVSKAAEQSFGGLLRYLPRRRVILSAVDLEKFHPKHRSEKWRDENGYGEFLSRNSEARIQNAESEITPEPQAPSPESPILVGLIGRFQNVKGQRYFLDAAAIAAAQNPRLRFLMAGQGSPKKAEWYRAFATKHGFGHRLSVQGMLPNLPEVMASLDIGVIASIGSEGSSRVTLELMASRVAVVATRVGGIPEILAEVPPVTPGEASPVGKLIPPRDAQAMADAILALAENQPERERLAQAGYEAAHRNHDPARWVEAIETVYDEAISRNAAHGEGKESR